MKVFLPEHPFYQRNMSIFSQTPTLFGKNTPLLEVPGPHQTVTKITPFRCFLYVDVYQGTILSDTPPPPPGFNGYAEEIWS